MPQALSPLAQNGFGTKAETLRDLGPLLREASVPRLEFFTVGAWRERPGETLHGLAATFEGASVAVRSSAHGEDGATHSMAGAYHSVLDVPASNSEALGQAIEEVLASYPSGDPLDQVLVQAMVVDVALSGVIMTCDLASGAPYHIINYDDESGRTDIITGGTGANKTVVVHHDALPEQVNSPRVARLLDLIHDLERIFGRQNPLDIEFAQTRDGHLHVLQVRRIAVQKNWNRAMRTRISEALEHISAFVAENGRPRTHLAGSGTVLGQMPDWNPAELIGPRPAPLALSLFQFLISDRIWREARASMGYRQVPREPLLVVLAGRPYVDVRHSFNSFLPAGLPADLEHRLIDAWMARLCEHPEFHDKVEFEVAETLLTFTFEEDHHARYGGVLSRTEREAYASALRALTATNLTPDPEGTLARSLEQVELHRHGPALNGEAPLRRALALLRHARTHGTWHFSRIARHAFMAEALLRSAVQRGALSPERLEAFRHGLDTIARQLGRDFTAVAEGKLDRAGFLETYGHLRPGTFDILSPRYDQRGDLFQRGVHPEETTPGHEFAFNLAGSERQGLATLLKEAGLPLPPEALLAHARMAIRGREQAKFIFTRHLSEALEQIAEWGDHLGLPREILADLTLADLEDLLARPLLHDPETHFHELTEQRRRHLREMAGLRLGYIIRDARDLYVVPLHRGAPNFVTRRRVEAEAVFLENRSIASTELFGRIAFIENADPGFDWIFTRGIVGLVTKFGGANSHMTIRCAELGLPAAIGVGEQTFDHLLASGRIELHCDEKVVRPCYG